MRVSSKHNAKDPSLCLSYSQTGGKLCFYLLLDCSCFHVTSDDNRKIVSSVKLKFFFSWRVENPACAGRPILSPKLGLLFGCYEHDIHFPPFAKSATAQPSIQSNKLMCYGSREDRLGVHLKWSTRQLCIPVCLGWPTCLRCSRTWTFVFI
jgi:hypothetical protein